MVSLDTDILFLDEADIVVGEGDLVQMQAAEEESHEDEEKADSPFLHNTHHPIWVNLCTGFPSLESLKKRDWAPSSAVELLSL